MDLKTFIDLHEQAKTRHAGEVAAIPYPNPLLQHYTFFSVMEGLRKDWRELAPGKDPGKHRPHRFWVRDVLFSDGGDRIIRCDRFWPEEVVDDLRNARVGALGPVVGQANKVPLGALADAMTRPCVLCKAPGPVIGTYMQTRNSIEFDEWQLSLAVLCAGCVAARPIHRESACQRFAHIVFTGA
ncbi:MAG TPA: hypothetical protein VL500_07975 [Candidatus Eisenbacteria bacterium]|jgi:hypothetical protein|nr:hypothetical protein [Candidatus Eisenbacteria bacterium]